MAGFVLGFSIMHRLLEEFKDHLTSTSIRLGLKAHEYVRPLDDEDRQLGLVEEDIAVYVSGQVLVVTHGREIWETHSTRAAVRRFLIEYFEHEVSRVLDEIGL